MLGPVALMCLLAQSQTLTLRGVTFHLTDSHNGYEDFLRAAVILDEPKNRELEAYIRFKTSTALKPTPAPRPVDIPADAVNLNLYVAQADQLEPVIRLIERGIAKPCHLPDAKYSLMTLQPELQYFRVVERVLQRAATANAGGLSSGGAARFLLDGLRFSRSIATGGTLNGMVARTCEQMAIFGIQKNFDKFSTAQLLEIEAWVEDVSAKPSPLLAIAEIERKGVRNAYDWAFTASREDLGWTDADGAEMVKTLHDMPIARRDQIYRRFFMRFEAPWSALKHQLSLPESKWLEPIKEENFVEGDPPQRDTDGKTFRSMMGLLRLFAALDYGSIDVHRICQSALTIRVQERILGLTCAVHRYNGWNSQSSLKDVFGKEPIDPATNASYGLDFGRYLRLRIFCHIPGLEDIDLRRAGTDLIEDPAPSSVSDHRGS